MKLLKMRTKFEEDTSMVLIYYTHLKTCNLERKGISQSFAKVVGSSLLWVDKGALFSVIEPYFLMLGSILVHSCTIVGFLSCLRSVLAYLLDPNTCGIVQHIILFYYYVFAFVVLQKLDRICLSNYGLIGSGHPHLSK